MENSKISWTDHTFNPWIGCEKVSAGCKNCYAQVLDNRWNGGHWGPGSSRQFMAEANWKKPVKWNADAEKEQTRKRVFCASLADVFEDHPETVEPRKRLFDLIVATPWLDWLLLTKRPENIIRLSPVQKMPDNVWLGTSVENQQTANARIPFLLNVDATIHFLSMEPLLEPVELEFIEITTQQTDWYNCLKDDGFFKNSIDWVIVGGESGHSARPMHPAWIRDIRDHCFDAGVAFHFKQWGEWYTRWIDISNGGKAAFKMYGSILQWQQKDWANKGDILIDMIGKHCKTGENMANAVYPVAIMQKVGKKESGRELDGRTWDELPY